MGRFPPLPPPDEAMRVRVLRVRVLLLLLLLLFVHAGVCCVASMDLVQVPNRYRFVCSSRNSEVAGAHITFPPFSTGTHVIWAGYFCSCSTPGWSDRLDW